MATIQMEESRRFFCRSTVVRFEREVILSGDATPGGIGGQRRNRYENGRHEPPEIDPHNLSPFENDEGKYTGTGKAAPRCGC
jgi:hypothetical protein